MFAQERISGLFRKLNGIMIEFEVFLLDHDFQLKKLLWNEHFIYVSCKVNISHSICFLCREFQSSKYNPGYPGHRVHPECLRGQARPLAAAPGPEAAQQASLARGQPRRGQGGGRGPQGAWPPQRAETEDAWLQPPWQHQLRGNIQTQVRPARKIQCAAPLCLSRS